MYYVVGRLIKDNKAVGFRCIYRDKASKTKEVNLSHKSVDRLIYNGGSIDIGKNRRGYYFKDKKRYISDLERYDIDALSKERNRVSDVEGGRMRLRKVINSKGEQGLFIVKEVLTGNKLKKYIDKLEYTKEITKIKHLKEYLTDRKKYYSNCFIITGMKRTGKTVLVEQAIRYLLNKGVSPKDILLIQYKSVDDNISDEIDKLVKYIERTKCKFIFIDEITMLREFVSRSKGITDYICKIDDKRVVLSGSDTMAFILAETEYLNSRCYKLSTTVLEYKDWYNITKESLSGQTLSIEDKRGLIFDYMADCTLNEYSYYKSNKLMYQYLMSAISENIINSINKNTVYNCEEFISTGLGNMTKEKVLFIFYVVCYDAVHKAIDAKVLAKKDIRVSKYIGALVKNVGDKEAIDRNRNKISNVVLKNLGMDLDIRKRKPVINDNDYYGMLRIMRSMGVVERCKEYINIESDIPDNDEYVLKVPSIYSRFIESIFDVCKEYYSGLEENIYEDNKNDAYGMIFEAMITTQILEYINEYNDILCDRIGKLRIDNNKEIDIIIYKENRLGISGCLYDVKLSNKLNQRHFKAFDKEIMDRYSGIIKAGHAGIIYTGETATLRNGLVAINAHDFLMDIGKYIN